MKDSFGKEWYDYDNDSLNKFIKIHRLQLTIEYKTNEMGNVYFHCSVKCRKNKNIFDYNDLYPLNDSQILSHLKNIVREQKINKLLNGRF